jgi:hypothetical protein
MINSDLKTDYPRAEIWRLFIDDDDDEDSSYRKISSVELQGYYQSKGIYQFNVSLNYENGDFLAVYQPDASNSHVILHYTPNISTGFTNGVVTAEKPIDFIRPFNLRSVTNQYVLIHPITSSMTPCFEGITDYDTFFTNALQVCDLVTTPHSGIRLFPNIRFPHDGIIKKWILSGIAHMDGSGYPELQVWRSETNANNETIFNKINSYLIRSLNTSQDENVYEYYYTQSEVQYVKKGDLLGIFRPANDRNSLEIYYRPNSGLQNLMISETTPPERITNRPNKYSILYDVPMISAVIGDYTPTSTDGTVHPSSVHPSSDAILPSTINTPTGGIDVESYQNYSTVLTVAIALGGLALISNSICIVVMCLVIFWKKKNTKGKNFHGHEIVNRMKKTQQVNEIPLNRESAMQYNPLYDNRKIYQSIYQTDYDDQNIDECLSSQNVVSPYAVTFLQPRPYEEWTLKNCPDGFVIKYDNIIDKYEGQDFIII